MSNKNNNKTASTQLGNNIKIKDNKNNDNNNITSKQLGCDLIVISLVELFFRLLKPSSYVPDQSEVVQNVSLR